MDITKKRFCLCFRSIFRKISSVLVIVFFVFILRMINPILANAQSCTELGGTCLSIQECGTFPRIEEGDCPQYEICCNLPRPCANLGGTCLSIQECGTFPRIENAICPTAEICCNLPRPCANLGGTCLPIQECGTFPRIEDAICPQYEVCCNLPRPCDDLGGTCMSVQECSQFPRINNAICPQYEVCCNLSAEPCGDEGGECCTRGAPCVSPLVCNNNHCVAQINANCGVNCTRASHPYGYCAVDRPSDCERPPADDEGAIDCPGTGGNSACGDCLCCINYHPPIRCPAVPPGATITVRPTMAYLTCITSGGVTGINTAIGCLPISDRNSFLSFILRWAIGISGGVSFVLIIYSGFSIMTAAGDKRKLQAGKELLTAAILGLMLVIFSVFILDIVGIRILNIPGL